MVTELHACLQAAHVDRHLMIEQMQMYGVADFFTANFGLHSFKYVFFPSGAVFTGFLENAT